MSASILHVSDLDSAEIDVSVVADRSYDAVVSTGDFGRNKEGTLRDLNSLGDSDTPVYVISGNCGSGREWDVYDWIEDSIENDYEHLENGEWSVQEIGDYNVALGGWFFGPEREQQDMSLIHGLGDEISEYCEEYCISCEQEEKWLDLLDEHEDKQLDAMFHHGVPYMEGTESEIDVLTGLKAPVTLHGEHNGSLGFRKAVDQEKPAFAGAGHTHEGEGSFNYNGTKLVNGGMGRAGIVTLYTQNDSVQVFTDYFDIRK